MYYVDTDQIYEKIAFIDVIKDAIAQLQTGWKDDDLLLSLAQERILHLAIETVTDIGSCIIDGLMLREASSYEDIIVVLDGENVFPKDTAQRLIELVRLRKPLVQQYTEWDRSSLHKLIPNLSKTLEEFAVGASKFLKKELESIS